MTNDISGFIDLYWADQPEGNRPNGKGWVKIDNVRYEFACWPDKKGRAGLYTGTVKPERAKEQPQHSYAPTPSADDDAW